MTTQINVIVDNGGLSEKAKRQTQANRWSKLESDNRQKVEAAGTQQRDATRAQQGIGADGRPLFGTPPAQVLRRDEPAARQLGGNKIDMLMVPDQGFSSSGVMPVQSKTSAYSNVVSIAIDGNDIYTNNVPEPIYEPNGGPNASGALKTGGFSTVANGSASYSGELLTASNGPMYAVGFQSGSFVLQKSDESIEPVKSKLKAKDIKSVTWECLFRIGENTDGSTDRQIDRAFISGQLFDLDDTVFRSIDLLFSIDWFAPGTASDPNGFFSYEIYIDISNGSTEGSMYSSGTELGFDAQGNRIPWPGTGGNQLLPKPELGKWMHIAFVKNEVGLSVFVAGKQVLDISFENFPSNGGSVATVANEFINPVIIAKIESSFSMGDQSPNGPPYEFLPVIFHGLRVTPKALYSGDFTPPTSITSYG